MHLMSPTTACARAAPFSAADDAAELASIAATSDADCSALRSWGCYPEDEGETHRLVIAAFASTGLLQRFSVPLASLRALVMETADRMQDNPFHNWRRVRLAQRD